MSRLNPESALRDAAAETLKLARYVADVSTQLASAAGQGLARDLQALAASDLRRRLRVDVAVPAALDGSGRDALAALLGAVPDDLLPPDRWAPAEGERALRAFALGQPPLTPTSELVPPYLVIALTAAWRDEASVEELEELARLRARVLLVPLEPLPPAEVREIGRRLQTQAWIVDLRTPAPSETTPPRPWLEELAGPEWEAGHAVAQAFAVTLACDRALKAFRLLLQRETDGLRVRRVMVEQRVQQARESAATIRPPELARELEGMLKAEYADFARGITNQLAEWTAPQTGALGLELTREIGLLAELHEQPMSGHVELTVPEAFERSLLDRVHQRLLEQARRTLMSLVDLQDALRERIHERLRSLGAPAVPLAFEVPALEQFERFLLNRLHVETPYRSEGAQAGLGHYMMAARRFAMPFTMVGGLLLSLGTVFSGGTPASQDGFFSLRSMLVIATAAATVVGGVLVWRRAPVERAEQRARELEKARELLRRELRRMVTDAEREWLRLLGEHLRDQPAELRATLERELETHVREQSRSTQDEHERIERQKAGLASTERQLASADQWREGVARELQRQAERQVQLFQDLQREAARRPAPREQAV